MQKYNCETCNGDNFSFDGQHMICKSCGTVLIREVKSALDIEREQIEFESELRRRQVEESRLRTERSAISGHYKRMKNFDQYINDSSYVDDFACIRNLLSREFMKRTEREMMKSAGVESHFLDAMRYGTSVSLSGIQNGVIHNIGTI